MARLCSALIHIDFRVAHASRSGDRRREQSVAERTTQPLHRRTSSCNIHRRNLARRMRVGLERRNARSKDFALIFELVALEHAADDLDALAHYSRRSNFLAFPFADFFHEDLRRAEAQKEAVTGEILHNARFHRDLDGMSRVRRNNSPTELNARSLAGDDSENRGRRARLKRMFTPPWISFSDPEGIETRVLTGLGHSHGFTDRLHAELKDSDVEWNSHSDRSQVPGVRCQAKQNLILVAAELNPQNITVVDFPDTCDLTPETYFILDRSINARGLSSIPTLLCSAAWESGSSRPTSRWCRSCI